MVARLGSVKDAAKMLNVSEPAVSQALTALRQHLGDQLIMRNGATMTLTTAYRYFYCSVVADFIKEHTEYADLIDPAHPGSPRCI
jgi:DNA-binding transcriptional LysR family regulator